MDGKDKKKTNLKRCDILDDRIEIIDVADSTKAEAMKMYDDV